MSKVLFLFSLMLVASMSRSQINVELIHQLVQHSKDEYDRQLTARNRQAITSAMEEVNKGETSKLKSAYRILHSRFTTLNNVLQALGMGMESAPLISEIVDQQTKVFKIAGGHPELVLLASNAERDIAGKALQLGRYLVGLFSVAGDLNQMKPSDRKILYGHVLDELRRIAGASRGLATTMSTAISNTASKKHYPFTGYIERDRHIVERILRRWEELDR